jgi:hypothetical protein
MGILSKITPRFFKKVVRKVGRAIKWATKPIRKVLRKILKPIGKAFDKLGWVGTLALMIWGGPIGAWVNSWLGSFGTAFMQGITKAMPKLGGFLANVGKGIRTAATWTKNAFSSITDVMSKGVNRIAEGFGWNPAAHGGRTLTDAFGDWATRVRDRIQNFGKTTNDPMSMIDSTLQPEKMFIEDMDPNVLKNLTGTDVLDPSAFATDQGQLYARAGGIPPEVSVPVSGTPITGTPITTTVKKKGPLGSWFSGRGFSGEMVATPIPGSPGQFDYGYKYPVLDFAKRVTESPVGKAASIASAGYGAYQMFKGDPSYEEPYYNANTSLSNAMLAETEQPTYMDELAFNGNFGSPQQDFNTMAQNYITGFGHALPSNTTDYMSFAQNLPGYGYQFADYLQDSLYGQQNPYYTG